MARVPEEAIERLKREVSLVELVKARGIALTGGGDNLMGLCPFHPDKTPSLVVSPSKNIWHCLGACQAGGSVIDWVMRAEKVSFRLAVELLAKQSPSLAARAPSKRPRLEALAHTEGSDDEVLSQVVAHYHATLKTSEEAQAYLKARGLDDAELVDHFRLGYANRTLGYRLPQAKVSDGAALRAQLQRLGIYRSTGHEHFNGSLVVPVVDESGRVREMYGRKTRDDLRKGTPAHLYLPGDRGGRGVFNLAGLHGAADVIVCEALIDALTFWRWGFRNVTTAYGVEGFTAELRAALLELQPRRVLIAYDRDDAGDRAAEKLARELGAAGLTVYRVYFPRGMDANAYALAVQPAQKALETALRGAKPMTPARAEEVTSEPVREAESARETEPGRTASEPIREAETVLEPEPVNTAHEPIGAAETALEAEPVREAEAVPSSPSVETAPREIAAPSIDSPSLVAKTPEPSQAPVIAPEPPVKELSATTSPPAASPAPSESPTPPNPPAPESPPTPGSKAIAGLTVTSTSEDEVRLVLGDRSWRIRGLAKRTTYDSLRINILVARGEVFFLDTIELYSARQRAGFVKDASTELRIEEATLKSDVTKVVLYLEGLIEARIAGLVKPAQPEMSAAEREAALSLLRDPRLLERVLEDFDASGVVGEETNKLIGYLAATSRKLNTPLAVVIQSSSAAGKSSLMDAVLRFMPEEERVQYSAMTGQSLFYMGETNLSHKILAIAEEQGAQSASYALKLLQSEGELRIASTGKDAATGKLVTQEYHVEGPVMIFLTTTAVEVDEELLNRCLVLTVDEGATQTAAIHARQRQAQTMAGLLARVEQASRVKLHQNAQRLLEPLFVANPHAETLRFPTQSTRARRDHMKYLTLMRSIALLHQHQREVKVVEHGGARIRYIEVEASDIAMADRLSKVVLSQSADELPPQTRRLHALIGGWVRGRAESEGVELSAVRFTRRDVRALTRWSDSALKKHLGRLEELEHLIVHGGGARRRTVYELAAGGEYDGDLVTPGDNWSPLWSPPGHGGGGDQKSIEKSCVKSHLVTPPGGAHQEAGAESAVPPPVVPEPRMRARLNGVAARGA